MAIGDFTQYSTVSPLVGTGPPSWMPPHDRDRLAAYTKYDEIYWSNPGALRLQQRGAEYAPIYIPNPRTIVDTTSHYLLKGLTFSIGDPDDYVGDDDPLQQFLTNSRFLSVFHTAKHSGVSRGDFVLHMVADPSMPEGRRITVESVDPSRYFPIRDDDDQDVITGVNLATQYEYLDPATRRTSTRVRKLTYRYELVDGRRAISVEEGIYELDENWWTPSAKLIQQTIAPKLLPSDVVDIPVYHFPNISWQGDLYGSSELRGFERLLVAVDQGISDEELALALDGLGVYSTDAGRPVDDNGNEVDWEVAPGRVMEVPNGNYFRRVEGLNTVTPMQDHLGYLDSKLYEASGTSDVARGQIDVQTAQSGIALAIKFMPTLAKIEERDRSGLDILGQLMRDWQVWMQVYESTHVDGTIEVSIGEKLPQDRVARLNELNNMYDRHIISTKFYRAEMAKLGYVFPSDIDDQIAKDAEVAKSRAPITLPSTDDDSAEANLESAQDAQGAAGSTLPPKSNQSNNKNRPNESSGTEAGK